MSLNLLKAYLASFAATSAGQMAASFLRVAVAAAFAAWMAAGFPVDTLSGADLTHYVVLGVQAGAALVLANYFGPWEKRYGRRAKRS